MNAAKMRPSRSDDLTPDARLERAKRTVAQAVSDIVEAMLAKGSAANEWIDQAHSPLGRRAHLRLAREGVLPSKKHGRRVLVRRDDLNAYIERVGLSRGRREDDDDVNDIVEQIIEGGRRR